MVVYYKYFRLSISVALLSVWSEGQPSKINTLQLRVDRTVTYVDYRLWSGHPYIRLRDTANHLAWYPLDDGYHNITDIAGCIRVEANSVNIYSISNDPAIGKSSVALVVRLDNLPAPTRLIQNELWIPVDSIAQVIGYKTSFLAEKHLLRLTSPMASDETTLVGKCMDFVKKHR